MQPLLESIILKLRTRQVRLSTIGLTQNKGSIQIYVHLRFHEFISSISLSSYEFFINSSWKCSCIKMNDTWEIISAKVPVCFR